MKKTLIAVLALFAIAANAGIKIAPAPNKTIHGGEHIAVYFTATGFAPGSTAQIWLVSTRTWQPTDLIGADLPVVPGANTAVCDISWSWFSCGPYVVRVVIGNQQYTGNTTYTIRSAVIWPYPGTVYPKDSDVWVTWATQHWIPADFLDIYLANEDTGEYIEVAEGVAPEAGRAQFHTPDVTGSKFRVVIEGYLMVLFSDEYGDYEWPDFSAATQSGLVRIQ